VSRRAEGLECGEAQLAAARRTTPACPSADASPHQRRSCVSMSPRESTEEDFVTRRMGTFAMAAVVGALLYPGWSVPRPAKKVSPAFLEAPAGNRPVEIHEDGETVLPNGRLITPAGRQVKVAPHPYGLALSPDGQTLITVNNSTNPFSISIITDPACRYSK